MKLTNVVKILKSTKKKFLGENKRLLDVKVNERSLTHKFAEHLQGIVGTDWKVDCEYNRYGNDSKIIDRVKSLVGEETGTANLVSSTVYPDIIVHKRGKKGPNFIIIEAKKTSSGRSNRFDDDKKKLRILKKTYSYKHAVFLLFDTENKTISWEFIEDD